MPNGQPAVSVCIPTYNTAQYLGSAIRSVLAQTFQDYELVVSDNASTDSTPELCRGFSDPRIRYVRYDELVNQGGNWNRCVALARGRYVALLHADDEYYPGFLADRVGVLEADPEVGLAFGAVDVIDENGEVTGRQSFDAKPFAVPAPEFFGPLLMGCVINPVSPMVRRSAYNGVGLFNEKRLWGIDWEMWLRLAAKYGVAYSPAVAARYRVHGVSGTSTGLLGARNGAEVLLVLRTAFGWIDSDPLLHRFAPKKRAASRQLGLWILYAAGFNCEAGNRAAVWRNLRYVAEADPTLLAKPTVWALAMATALGPWVYRGWKSFRPV